MGVPSVSLLMATKQTSPEKSMLSRARLFCSEEYPPQ